MANKGSISFVAMMVINPIVILFYQNFAMSSMSYAARPPEPAAVTRQVASVTAEDEAVVPEEGQCNGQKTNCPQPTE